MFLKLISLMFSRYGKKGRTNCRKCSHLWNTAVQMLGIQWNQVCVCFQVQPHLTIGKCYIFACIHICMITHTASNTHMFRLSLFITAASSCLKSIKGSNKCKDLIISHIWKNLNMRMDLLKKLFAGCQHHIQSQKERADLITLGNSLTHSEIDALPINS